jgi:SagB-type dehydrogenase family enzyme
MTETRLSLRPGVALVNAEDGALLQTTAGPLTVPAQLQAVLDALADNRCSEEALYTLARTTDGAEGAVRLQVALAQYARMGLLRHTLVADGIALAAVETFGGERFAAPVVALQADRRYRLSRFAVCRRHGNELIVESPLSRLRLALCAAPATTILAPLAMSRTVEDILACCPALSPAAGRALLEWMVAAKLAGVTDEGGGVEHDQRASSWPVDSLLFHARSRTGLYAEESGGTYRFRNSFPPLPARKPPMSADIIDLPRADLTGRGRPFFEVAGQRRDASAPGGRPLDARQLGELLYRTASLRNAKGRYPEARRFLETTTRPYPNGGAIYDVELYVIAGRCDGLAEGLYHYDPFAHALERLSGPNAHTTARLMHAADAAGWPEAPPLLVAMASRFQRRAWKYVGIAYANALKGAGVLQETMMLVATEMNLAARAIGAHDDGSFAAATGLDPEVEGLVGELLLAGGSGRAA